MDNIYGIDLGTSNCLVGEFTDAFGEQEVNCLNDDEGNISFSSVVHFAAGDKVIVGEKAKNILPEFPEKTIELVKVRIGKKKREIPVLIDGKEELYSPQEISALLLDHFNDLYNEKIKRAVLTVPAYFDQNQRDATLQAGEIAGIEIEQLIDEPSAAIMYHFFNDYQNNENFKIGREGHKNYLVFDFGGGTFDLSLINVELDDEGNLTPSVLLKEGDNELGGNVIDFDFVELILFYLIDDYGDDFIKEVDKEFKYYRKNLRFKANIKEEIKEFIMRLRATVEYAKIKLSKEESVTIEVGKHYRNYEISRKEFEIEILDRFFRNPVKTVLNRIKKKIQANLKGGIDEIIMVGGASQIPYFKRLLEVEFPNLKNKIRVSEDYNNAVAKGAAIFAGILKGLEIEPFGNNKCSNTVTHDIYIKQKGADSSKLLVSSGMDFPFEKSKNKEFEIAHALQTNIHIIVKERYQSYNQKLEKREIKTKEIKDIKFYHPFFYKGEEIIVGLDIDEQGIFDFSAIHKPTGEKIDFQAEKLYQLDENEFDEAVIRTNNLKSAR